MFVLTVGLYVSVIFTLAVSIMCQIHENTEKRKVPTVKKRANVNKFK